MINLLERKYRLILCDIDGTLAAKLTNEITDETKKVIEELHHAGYLFGLASGRSVSMLQEYKNKWGLDFDFDVCVALNGSSLYDGLHKQEYDFFQLKKEWVEEIVRMMGIFNEYPSIYTGDVTRYYYKDHHLAAARKDPKRKIVVVEDLKELCPEDTPKIVFHLDSEEKMQEMEAYALAHSNNRYKAVKTQKTVLEFVHAEASKLYSIERFCEMNGIALEEVMAFGDTSNDNEMLQGCGCGVCLLNGSEDTKQAADFVTDKECADDGFADFIRKHVLTGSIHS